MTGTEAQADPRRWKALVFICLAQLMIVLDSTIMNIALPSAQRDLGFADSGRQWTITAYALTFGGLLLLGGRIGDRWGRKPTFVTAATGFAAASALGGLAANTGMLLAARALQGVFAALLAPAVLSLIAVTFTATKERAKAFGIMGAMAGSGSAIGLLLGGVLTEYWGWRWTLLINIAFAALAVAGALAYITDKPSTAARAARLDLPGAILATGGLVALVFGFTQAEQSGWTAPAALLLFALALVLLTAFVVVQRKVKAPLLPLRVVLDRNRGGAYLALLLSVAGMFAMFLFITFYLQTVKGFTPLQTGLAFLPMSVAMMTGSTQIGARLAPRLPARALMPPALLVAAAGLVVLAQITPHTSYAAVVLPGMLLLGLGLGTVFTTVFGLATAGVQPQDAGIASAMVNTSQQVGGAIGTALLNTIATTSTATYLSAHAEARTAGTVHGFATATWAGTAILTAAALVAALLINHRPAPAETPARTPQPTR
ncbi:MFS transporter [Streptomyces luteoverticillatus]|uniref:MFS transporter n=1 Tax=Streptomyces luteoverticillatus TaxID=66425 RepID=A0A3S9PPP1_STRLT|nr:MFS transporter [Streptomyces luteoverticillatus]AZQ74366.1 MFS transporter [Streptomyces luteoverticillatus]